MKLIKIGIRQNLIYPLMIIVFTFFRKVDSIIMSRFLHFDGSVLLTLIMFLSESVTGLIFFIYYLNFMKRAKIAKFMGIKLIQAAKNIKPPDKNIKIYFLIFQTAFYDFNIFILQANYFPKFEGISKSLDIRIRSILTISNSFLCYYILRLNMPKHQKFSLFIISISILMVIIIEFFFEEFAKNRNGKNFMFILIFMILNYIFNSFLDIIEKYLIEVDFINIFKLLMLEGLFGFLLTLLYAFIENPFKEAKEVIHNKNNKEKSSIKFIFLIICLIIYFITSGGRNVYRIATNKYYSPMARTLTDSFLDPLFIVYYFFVERDFSNSQGSRNVFYFIINLIFSIIIVFCGCVYNELFVLFFYNLQHETHFQVSKRASMLEDFYLNENEEIEEND